MMEINQEYENAETMSKSMVDELNDGYDADIERLNEEIKKLEREREVKREFKQMSWP